MTDSNPHDSPSDVTAQNGEVLVDGPNGHAYSFTLEAAVETSARLLLAAAQAGEQQIAAGRRKVRG